MTSEIEERKEYERSTWQYRAIEATHGNQTQMGCIILAIIGRPAKHPPWFGPSCVITQDGLVLSNFVGRRGGKPVASVVCDVEDLVANFRGLADHLKLSDEDRTAMFDELRKWISIDYRADHDELKRHS